MIPETFKLLLEEREYKFYFQEDIGFYYKDLALTHSLYEDFSAIYGPQWCSGYEEIFLGHECQDKKISQVWIYDKEDNPCGLCMAIHYDTPETVKNKKYNLSVSVLGHIQLYVHTQHRGQGLSALSIPFLEEALLKTKTPLPPAIVLQDKAYRLSEYVNQALVLPYGIHSSYKNENHKFVNSAFKAIFEKNDYLSDFLKNYPDFSLNIQPDFSCDKLMAEKQPKIKF